MNDRIILFTLLAFLLLSGCSSNNDGPVKIIDTPTGSNSHLPFLTSDQSGAIFLSWVEPDSANTQSMLRYSKLSQTEWTPPKTIATSDQWFVNWADYPSILADSGNIIAAHTLRKIPGNAYSYNVNIHLNEERASWSQPVTPHFDSTATEHGFVSMTPWKNSILAIWLDGRRSHNRTEKEYFDIEKAMTLRSAVIQKNGSITQKKLIDESVCDCCNTSLALTSQGPIAAYRNRTDDEIRDIYVSRFINNSWSAPKPVYRDNWNIAACPVNGPAIAAGDSTVAVAWYTAVNGKQAVKAATSTNYGATFSDPITINDNQAIGRVDAVMDKHGKAFVSWMETSGQNARLKVKALQKDKNSSETITITRMNPSRKSGFPQMELTNEKLIFAWTHTDSLGSSVKTATLSLSDIK